MPDFRARTYRPHFVIGNNSRPTTEEMLGVQFVDSAEGPVAGVPVNAVVELLYPEVDYSPLQPGVVFTVHEGITIVGDGRVTGSAG